MSLPMPKDDERIITQVAIRSAPPAAYTDAVDALLPRASELADLACSGLPRFSEDQRQEWDRVWSGAFHDAMDTLAHDAGIRRTVRSVASRQ